MVLRTPSLDFILTSPTIRPLQPTVTQDGYRRENWDEKTAVNLEFGPADSTGLRPRTRALPAISGLAGRQRAIRGRGLFVGITVPTWFSIFSSIERG